MATDNINALTPRITKRLHVDFTWLNPGDPYTYPTGVSSEAPTVRWGSTVTFQAAWSSSDGLAPVSFEWNFGDGVRKYGPTVNHIFAVRNNHQRVSLSVMDNLGGRHYCGHQMLFYDDPATDLLLEGDIILIYDDSAADFLLASDIIIT